MEAAVRFSQNSLPGQPDQFFLKIDVAGRVLQLYNIKTEHRSSIEFELVHASSKLPHFRAFDWHPTEPTLVAIGHTGGDASLVNLSTPQENPIAFNVRSPRSCNAVGLNSHNWLAAGLEKVRNDFCLNIWDLNQRISSSYSKTYTKGGSNEPLHKLAGGEPISSLRFFQDQPQLLAAGVKGQFIRLYDLRESTSTYALQVATRCVNNIAIDMQDEHFFASCLPTGTPTVSIWDRRMVSRTNVPHIGFGNYISQPDQHPEVSVELRDIIDPNGQIWGLRYSKTQRGQLGVLSSTGQVRVLKVGVDHVVPESSYHSPSVEPNSKNPGWDKELPIGVFLDNIQNFSTPFNEHPFVEESKRIISFDFTTGVSDVAQAKIITLTADGKVNIKSVNKPGIPCAISSQGFFDGRFSSITNGQEQSTSPPLVSKLPKWRYPEGQDQSIHELDLLSQSRKRCEAGYLLDAAFNSNLVEDEKQKVFWLWLHHAGSIAAGGALIQGDVDFSYLGVFAFWMEEIDIKSRIARQSPPTGSLHISFIIREISRRLNITRGKGCPTEYPYNRAICLYVSGLPWHHDELERQCNTLIAANEHTKAAAIALFAGEEKLAQHALRAKGSGNSHKMLAMALFGAKNRHRRMNKRRNSHDSSKSQGDDESDSAGSQDDEWQDIVTAVAEDLTDCYARSILAYVKTGSWEDVVKQEFLPLRYRMNIALRHFDDSKLTRYLSSLKQEVINNGDLEGILLTGLGTSHSVELLQKYVTRTNDLQTAALGLSFAAASDRYLPQDSIYARKVTCFRKIYKTQLMSFGLKFDKARFDIALSRAMREHNMVVQPRKKEQIRLVCSHCSQSISQFGHDQQISEQNAKFVETAKHPLGPEKAAVAGVVCPKCGRHLPRCGVCDLWLGTPDETYSKWYKPSLSSQRNSNAAEMNASMVGSTITTIGPHSNTPSISITGTRGATTSKHGSKKLTTADLSQNVLEVVDEEVAKQEKEKRWYEAMHRLTVFCTVCSHGFHAEHAKMWFDGVNGMAGHRTCPVPLCECLCNG